jgi:hypothetical protein
MLKAIARGRDSLIPSRHGNEPITKQNNPRAQPRNHPPLVAVVRELHNRWFEQVRASLLSHASISEPTGAAHANCYDGRSRSRAFLPPTFCRGRPAAPVYAIFFTMHVYRRMIRSH